MQLSRVILAAICHFIAVFVITSATQASAPQNPITERTLNLSEITKTPATFRTELGKSGQFTWWLPADAQQYILPISAGIAVDPSSPDLIRPLQNGSPWSLLELPALGLNYRTQMVVIIVPWPHYAELIVTNRLGIRFSLPQGRPDAAPVEIVACSRPPDVLEVARAFREWRNTATNTGAIPRPRPLSQKLASLNQANRLLGAPHFYLWGPALFSRHDVPRNQWIPLAKALQSAPPDSFAAAMVNSFSKEQLDALRELAKAQWPMDSLTLDVALAIDAALSKPHLPPQRPQLSASEVIDQNKAALAKDFSQFLNPPESWGDGPSKPLLESLHQAGIERALLILSDLYARSAQSNLATCADRLGYLLGPYDSYHSVHSPTAHPNDTWETAQFDRAAYDHGRVLNSDGSGHSGFRGRGYHFSPKAAWPYVQQRVNSILTRAPYSAWFVDCDATAECFEDFNPNHPTTKVQDTTLRRQRLAWLESHHQLVVGSEGGSVLFADLIHFGHGVHTPYIGHLDPALRDRQSPYYLGRHWPPDAPDQSFKSVPLPPALKSPYFDPTVRIPLYQAALGDEVVVSHHWSFDSLKFSDLEQTRELMELLYMVPPMYHLNRQTWPLRRERILKHLAFWGPLHRQLATAPLIRFAWLTPDRLLQRSTFQTRQGEVSITVNFGDGAHPDCPPHSALVSGTISAPKRTYRADK